MADICIFYARENRELVSGLAAALSTRWDVWWDDKIVGRYPEVIEREIRSAKCAIPIWSPESYDNAMVRDELSLATKHNLPLLPVRASDCGSPFGYGSYSVVDLGGWESSDEQHPGFQQLLRRVASVVPPNKQPVRPSSLAPLGLKLPAVFLSVSSHETQLDPLEAMRALRVFGASTALISAYDLSPKRRIKGLLAEMATFRKQGGLLLIDSGNYESSRRVDKKWSPLKFKTALKPTAHDLACSFDVMKPSRKVSLAINEVVAAARRDAKFTRAPIVPIVHAALNQHGYILDELPAIIRGISELLAPLLIAVPERELGPGLIERARSVRRIRQALNTLPFYQPLHLLGTGNPWSIGVLAAAGADSFDGLEWCRVSVDHANGRLHHFQHFDFFAYQARLAKSVVTSVAVDDDRVDFAGKVAFSNLEYFTNFTTDLQKATAKGSLEAFVVGLIGKANAEQLGAQIPDLFQ